MNAWKKFSETGVDDFARVEKRTATAGGSEGTYRIKRYTNTHTEWYDTADFHFWKPVLVTARVSVRLTACLRTYIEKYVSNMWRRRSRSRSTGGNESSRIKGSWKGRVDAGRGGHSPPVWKRLESVRLTFPFARAYYLRFLRFQPFCDKGSIRIGSDKILVKR